MLLLCFAGVLWQFAEGTPESRQYLPGVIHVEEIDRRRVLAFKKSNLQLPHEAGRRHPEVIAHHDDALYPAAIALPQGLHQVRVFFFLLGVQPLLELVEDDQHLLADRNALPRRNAASVAFRLRLSGRAGHAFAGHAAGGFRFLPAWPRRRRRSRRPTAEATGPL